LDTNNDDTASNARISSVLELSAIDGFHWASPKKTANQRDTFEWRKQKNAKNREEIKPLKCLNIETQIQQIALNQRIGALFIMKLSQNKSILFVIGPSDQGLI